METKRFEDISLNECSQRGGVMRDGVCLRPEIRPHVVGEEMLEWDTSDIMENMINERINNPEEYGFEGMSEGKIRNVVYESDLSAEWDFLLDGIMETLREKNPTGCWHVAVKGFGWRGLSGEKDFCADTAQEFLSGILPETECSFNIFDYGNGVAIQNFHHDAPTGKEWYYALPSRWEEISEDVWYNEGLGKYLMVTKAEYGVEMLNEGDTSPESLETGLSLEEARDFIEDHTSDRTW